MRFNIARCHEAQGAIQNAQNGYNAVLKDHPDFVECLLRLGYIQATTGKPSEAEKIFLKCAELDDGKQEAWTCLCNIKLRYRDWAKAKDYAKSLLECATSEESKSFAHVLRANVYFDSVPSVSDKKDPQLETKRFLVWVNLGSLHLARGEANDAARMYTAALTRFYRNKDPKVSMWLARAYYDAKDPKNCKRALLKAIHAFPDDQALYFNLGLTMQNAAATVIGAPPKADAQPGATRAELERSSVALMQAAGLFKRLMLLPKAQLHSRNLKKENIGQHVQHCDKLSKTASQLIDKVKTADEIRQKQVDEHEQRSQIMREAAEVQRRMQEETELTRRTQQQEALQEDMKKRKARNEEWIQQRAINAATKKGDSTKAAKARQRQQELEAENAMQYEASYAAAMARTGSSSSDEEYDEDAMEHDAAEAEADERRAREAGYNSNDEKGTADAEHGEPAQKAAKKKSSKKRHRREAAADNPEVDELADLGLGDDLDGEDDAMPAEKKRAVLESDDDE